MAKIKYNGETLAEIKAGQSITLHTDGHELDGDLVIEGFNGGGSANCDGCIIEVDTLPTEGIDETALYTIANAFSNLILVMQGQAMSFVELAKVEGITCTFNTIPTKATIGINETDLENVVWHLYYIEDEAEKVFIYADTEGTGATWIPLSMMWGTYLGSISSIDEADVTTNGFYSVGGASGGSYYKYLGGKTLVDVYLGNSWTSLTGNFSGFYYVTVRPDVGISSTTNSLNVYYEESTNTLLYFMNNTWIKVATITGIVSSRAEAIRGGYYVLVKEWQEYIVPKGSATISSTGTVDVTRQEFVNVSMIKTYIAQTVAELPTSDVVAGSLAIVLEGGE